MFVNIRSFLRENGSYVLLSTLAARPGLLLRNRMLASKLKVRKLHIGPRPYLRGLSCISMGEDFLAGEGLWLHAITHFGRQRFEPRLTIGNHVRVSNWSHIACTNSVSIGDHVLVGSKVMITDHNHGIFGADATSPRVPPVERLLDRDRSVTIEKNVWLGDGVVVCPGVTIGEGSVAGANAVVTNDVPPFTLVAGVPAKPIRRYGRCTGPLDQSMKRAACTIVSANYLHFAWTLAESFLQFHPDDEFHLLLVDRMPLDFVSRDPRVQVHEVEKLGLPDFRSLAFKYDILELNTAVKPTFLKHLFTLGAEKVIYFDPDIYIFREVELVYEALGEACIVLTPHVLRPTSDPDHVCEKDSLGTGVFNLGFVAVSNSAEGRAFLDWWEERCLRFGFEDLRSGLFVDQKWVNLAPCFFEGIHVLRHDGCNVAYWNLPERNLSENDSGYLVNRSSPLIFFHYSGYKPEAPDRLSTKLRFTWDVNETLRRLLLFYGARLKVNGAEDYRRYAYSYARFSDGSLVPQIARKLYSVTIDRWGRQDPFDANGGFFKAARKAGLISKQDRSGQYSSNNLPAGDWRVKTINRMLFFLPKLIGGDRYTMLMKYLSFIAILRNQGQLLVTDEPQAVR